MAARHNITYKCVVKGIGVKISLHWQRLNEYLLKYKFSSTQNVVSPVDEVLVNKEAPSSKNYMYSYNVQNTTETGVTSLWLCRHRRRNFRICFISLQQLNICLTTFVIQWMIRGRN